MKNKIQDLLVKGKTKQVIQQLRQLSASDQDLQQQVLLLAARFAANEKQRHAGTLPQDLLNQEQNKIHAALLAVAEQLFDEQNPSRSAKSKWLKIGGAIAAVIGVLAGIAGFTGYSLKDLFGTKTEEQSIGQPEMDHAISDTVIVITTPKEAEPAKKTPAAEPKEVSPTRNHFESNDESKQINVPDNHGTINIDQ